MIDAEPVIAATRAWVEDFVVDLNLCPFARREVEDGTIRYVVSNADTVEALALALQEELAYLEAHPAVETTLLIHPGVLTDFLDYNDFLDVGDEILEALGLTGTFQLASFHPAYRFADSGPEAPENYTNRSPYPMLHLLREASVARAVGAHPAIETVPQENIGRLRRLGTQALQRRLEACRPRGGAR